ncbi:hypothetical protein GCM10011354_32780 [Egicoccus halophilus]|uniref:GerMN domain-containing protein n=2 Tax=Egicoccus halophilus TaxID=1670830 RepID=A0A8J3AAU2_9ACTN|nr:hypothetical protein GCM10011354_32780 [Egicoccus halophilus]
MRSLQRRTRFRSVVAVLGAAGLVITGCERGDGGDGADGATPEDTEPIGEDLDAGGPGDGDADDGVDPSDADGDPSADDGDPGGPSDTDDTDRDPVGENADDGTDDTDRDPVGGDDDAAERVVEVFFTDDERGDLSDVFPVQRTVTGPDVLHGALEELLAGPSSEEEAEGYAGWFSEETTGMLNSAAIDDGTATVDFDAELREAIPNASTSTGSQILLAQLDATVTQFPTVDDAVYSLDGDVDAFYTWLQLVPPER